MLTDNQIKKFIKIYEKQTGQKIKRKDAYDKAIKLVNLMKRIYKPKSQKHEITTKKI